MKCVSYTRTLPWKNHQGELAIAEQNQRIAAYLAEHKELDLLKKYSDRKNDEKARTAFDQMTDDGVERKFDCIIVASMYYCGPDFPAARQAIKETLYATGIDLIVLDEGLDTRTASRKEVEDYFEAKRCEMHAEIMFAWRRKQGAGFRLTSSVPFGYIRRNGESNMIKDEEVAPYLSEAFSRYASGQKMRDIAKWLNEQGVEPPMRHKKRILGKSYDAESDQWTTDMLRCLFRNPTYTGAAANGSRQIIAENCHEPYITKEQFYAFPCNMREGENKISIRKSYKKPNPLAKHIVCTCGYALCWHKDKKTEEELFYCRHCRAHKENGKNLKVPAATIYKKVMDALELEHLEEEKLAAAIQQGAGRKAIEVVRAERSVQMKSVLAELNRVQFQQMIEDAKAKKIDLILTKSISRFARNVVDCLTNIRLLRNLRPPVSVYFDKERLDSLDEKAEVFLTMLASFAQEESRSISTNIKWATRSRMKAGTQKISTTSLLGYDTDDDGEMVIVTNEAEIVRTIYMSFDKGMHPAEIAEKLNALEIRTIKNNPWTGESVKNILRNEKYCGDVLMQKTYTVDCLTHKTKKNEGEVEQYFIPDHHPAIVEREVWDKAQVRLEQIAGKRRRIRPKQQRLIPLRKGVLLGFVPIRPTWKAVSFKRLETATEKVMALVDAKPEQEHIEYESEECEMEILKGFEVINLKQPKGESVMTVTSNSLKFNKATAVELNYAPYIRVLLNAKTRQIAIQPCSEKDPNAIKFSNEESKQTYAISIKVPAIQVEFRRMLPFEDDNGGKLSYTLNGTLYPDEQVVIYDIGDVKPETEKKRRGRRKKSEIEAEQKEN